jgi:hypothetical protein
MNWNYDLSQAPHDGTEIWGLYGDDKYLVQWAEERQCMLAGVAGGNGYFGPGWQCYHNHLIVEEPDAWKNI